MNTSRAVGLAGGILLSGVLGACGGGGAPAGCDRWVSPGTDDRTTVQTMFEEAQDGETLCFTPGTYRFDDGVSIADRTDLTIRGTGDRREDVVLDFFEMGVGNDGLAGTSMTRFTVENLQVIDAAANDLIVRQSTDVTFRNVSAGWVRRPMSRRGRYALYPVESSRVIIEDSEAFGAIDAGIYVGQTNGCIIRNSLARDNVAGLEVENSTNCEVYGNTTRNNTAGILVFELPGLDQRGSTTLVRNNTVVDNNLENFATADVGIIALVPTGIGIMILAANQVEVRDNEIRGNESVGIAVVSYHVPRELGVPEPGDTGFDYYPDGICLHDNTFEGNGQAPWSPLTLITGQQDPPATTLEDIIWDGALREGMVPTDALRIDAGGSFRQANIDGLFATQSTDRAPVTGTCTPIVPTF
jgi:parallel beta-helix repeat protein